MITTYFLKFDVKLDKKQVTVLFEKYIMKV